MLCNEILYVLGREMTGGLAGKDLTFIDERVSSGSFAEP
jgi:hypothetical protein